MAKIWSIIVLAGALGLGAAGPAGAQNPSADQIIQSLRPAGPSMATRGIRPMNPAADAPAAAPPPAIEASAPVAPPPLQGGMDPHRVIFPPRTVSPPPPPPAAAPSVNLTVQFATGSAELTPAAVQTLDELGRALSSSALAGYRFRIEGHTDTVGSREHNRALSEARAAMVLDYLANKWNVARGMVMTVGMGQDHLLVPTGPNVAEPRNRRVTVINLGA